MAFVIFFQALRLAMNGAAIDLVGIGSLARNDGEGEEKCL
jgi:hypothetical protein